MGQTEALDMTRGSPVKLMIRFALPMMVGSVFQALYSMVDSAVLGRFVGAEALAAIGAASSTTAFLLMLATSVTTAVSIVMSQYVGSRDMDKIRSGLSATVWLTVCVGLSLGLASALLAAPLMRLLEAPENVRGMSVTYIRLVCGLCIASFAYNAVASVLRALGDSRTPLIFLILCSVLNVVLDLLAVILLGMGVEGVAIATVLSQAVSAAGCCVYMLRKYPQFRLGRKDLVPDRKVMGRILGMGGQMALQSSLLSVGMMAITRIINGYGSDIVAAFTVGSNVQNLAVMLFSNFSFGFSVYVGQNFGAKDISRICKGLNQMLLLVGGLSAAACLLSLLFARDLVGLYVSGEETAVIEAAVLFVRIQAWFYPFLGWIWLYLSTLKGVGRITVTTVSSFVELGSKIGFSLLLPVLMGGFVGIWYAAPLGWILGLIPLTAYYYSGRWAKGISRD